MDEDLKMLKILAALLLRSTLRPAKRRMFERTTKKSTRAQKISITQLLVVNPCAKASPVTVLVARVSRRLSKAAAKDMVLVVINSAARSEATS